MTGDRHLHAIRYEHDIDEDLVDTHTVQAQAELELELINGQKHVTS